MLISLIQNIFNILLDYKINNSLFTAKNPPPICTRIPYLWKGKACIKFSDNQLRNKTYHGCARLTIKAFGFKMFDKNMGCFNIKI